MTDIRITARGRQGCGKTTTTLRQIGEALIEAGIVHHNAMVVFGPSFDALTNSNVETIAFTAQPAREKTIREKIFGEVDRERDYQTDKWGVEADDTKNTPWMWTSYVCQYATKWMTGLFTTPTKSVDLFRSMMIKVAATAVAAVESLDRQRAANGTAFYEE